MRKIGESLGVRMFELPPRVGGRFSVLSAVGLLPAALTGMDVNALLAGARDMAEWIASSQDWENPACGFAGVQFLEDTLLGRRVSVMMPYSARLRDLADWYRQLWAESLGKATDRQGRTVNVGPLPVKSLGVTDQHSQLQLYAEGPDDKVVTFLEVGEFTETVRIPAPGAEADALVYLGGHTLAELLWAEQKSTAWALAQRGRPSLTITVPRVDAFSLGALIYLLESATAIAGELYDVDAFDQPGVELSKMATYALMGRPGYQMPAEEIAQSSRDPIGCAHETRCPLESVAGRRRPRLQCHRGRRMGPGVGRWLMSEHPPKTRPLPCSGMQTDGRALSFGVVAE